MRDEIIATPTRSFYEIDEDFPQNADKNPKNEVVAYPLPNISRSENNSITGGQTTEQ
jgi:hypothetical protein